MFRIVAEKDLPKLSDRELDRLIKTVLQSTIPNDEEVAEIAGIYFSLKSFRGGRQSSLCAWLSRITVNFVMMNYAVSVVPKILA